MLYQPAPLEKRLESALGFAAFGFEIIPDYSVDDEGACRCSKRESCTDPGKHPMRKKADASDSEEAIAKFFDKHPDMNPAAFIPEDIFVLDVEASGLQWLQDVYGSRSKSDCFVVASGSGGRHLYFRGAQRLLSRLHRPRKKFSIVDGQVELLLPGSKVTLPPSLHHSGNRYELKNEPDYGIPELPQWLEDAIVATPGFAKRAGFAATKTSEAGGLKLTKSCALADHPGAEEGSRHNTFCELLGPRLNELRRIEQVPELIRDVSAWAARCTPPWPFEDMWEQFLGLLDSEVQKRQREDSLEDAKAGKLVAERFDEIEAEEVPWLIDEFIPSGMVTIISAIQGSGKSLFTVRLAYHLTRGVPIPGANPVGPFECAFMTREDHKSFILSPRLRAADVDQTKAYLFSGVTTDDGLCVELTNENINALREWLESHPDCKLVVIDPVADYLAADINENSNRDVRSALLPLVRLAQDFSVAIVLVSHVAKGEVKATQHRSIGSVAFTSVARMAFEVVTDPEDCERRLLLIAKTNITGNSHGLAYRLRERELPGFAKPVPYADIEEKVVDTRLSDFLTLSESASASKITKRDRAKQLLTTCLAKDGFCLSSTIDQLAEAEGIDGSTVRRAAKDLGIGSEKIGSTWIRSLPGKEEEARSHFASQECSNHSSTESCTQAQMHSWKGESGNNQTEGLTPPPSSLSFLNKCKDKGEELDKKRVFVNGEGSSLSSNCASVQVGETQVEAKISTIESASPSAYDPYSIAAVRPGSPEAQIWDALADVLGESDCWPAVVVDTTAQKDDSWTRGQVQGVLAKMPTERLEDGRIRLRLDG